MRILFIYPFPPAHLVVASRAYHYGVGYLSAVLRRDGHATSLLTINGFSPAGIDAEVRRFAPDLVALSVTSDQFPLAARVVEHLRRGHGLPVVMGGIHVTVAPEEAVALPGLLGVCLGEGERPLLELVRRLDAGEEPWEVPNFWFRRDGQVIKNPLGPLEELESLPDPDREVFNYQRIIATTGKASFSTGRGCPYLCPYCANHALRRIYRGCGGKYTRQLSPSRVVDEVVGVLGRYRGVRQVVFEDETFTYDRRWVRRFCEEYARRVDRPFACSTRIDHLDDEVLDCLEQANVEQLRVGIESGNEELRRQVVGKAISNAEIRDVCGEIRRRGIGLWTFNMIGLPGETEANIEETILLNKDLDPTTPFVSVFRPYPGTELERRCREEGWISSRRIHSYFQNVTLLDQPSISARRVAYYHNVFPWEVSYPRLAFAARALASVPIPGTETRSAYDLVFPAAFYAYKLKRFLTGE